jgi:hypothetical protein
MIQYDLAQQSTRTPQLILGSNWFYYHQVYLRSPARDKSHVIVGSHPVWVSKHHVEQVPFQLLEWYV